jgi:DNA gyrase subunit A
MESNTAQILYLFTQKGECATIPVQQLPQINEVGEGIAFSDLSPLSGQEFIAAGLCLPSISSGYIFMVTAREQVKRVRMEDVPGVSSKPFTMMKIDDGDTLIAAFLTDGQQQMMLTTAQGQTIRFSEEEVRPMGLPAGGVRGVKLQNDDDRVVSAMLADDSQYVWTITDDGVAKISSCEEYPSQGRAGQGVITMRLPGGSKEVAAATIGKQDDNVIVMTSKGKPLYMRIGRAPQVPRGRKGGDIIISLKEDERVMSVVSYQAKLSSIENGTYAASEIVEESAELED